MRSPRFLGRLVALTIFVAVLVVPLAAGAQTPMPGESPEVDRPWTWWLSLPIIAGVAGLALLVFLSYLRLSPRFYGKEEAPPPRPQPQYAGIHAPAYPAPAAPAPPQAEQPAPQAEQPAPQAPAPAQAEQPAPQAEQPAPQAEQPAPQAEQPAPQAEQPAPQAEQPAPQAEAPAEQKPAAEEPAKEAGPDQDVYERVLQEQLDKGVSPKVAEGRAKAAALRAGRQKAG